MISKRMTRAEMIRWLGDAISTETEKPFEEIDYDFVDECGCLLDKLSGKSDAVSENEIVDRIEKLKLANTSDKRRKVGRRKLWKILLAAAIVMCMTITVVAVPEFRTMIMTALNLNIGESVKVDGITFINYGEEKNYLTIDEMIESERFDFLLPRIQSENLKLEKIVYVGDSNTMVLCFNDTSITYEIWLDNSNIALYSANAANAIEYHFNGYTTYVVTRDISGISKYCSYTLVGNDIHNIVSSNLEDIELLISSIY